jgi:hypothetical protein
MTTIGWSNFNNNLTISASKGLGLSVFPLIPEDHNDDRYRMR